MNVFVCGRYNNRMPNELGDLSVVIESFLLGSRKRKETPNFHFDTYTWQEEINDVDNTYHISRSRLKSLKVPTK